MRVLAVSGRRTALTRVLAAALSLLTVVTSGPARGDWGNRPESIGTGLTVPQSDAGNSVDTVSGDASYAYTFALPPGRDGFGPQLTLRYSSARGNSWVGRGFYLDTPIIHRDTRSGAPHYVTPADHFHDPDRFVIDAGSPMSLIPWAAHPDSGTVEYRAARDDEDVQYLLDDVANTWTVRTRGGRVDTYSAAMYALPNGGGESFTTTYAWRLTKSRDRNGNTIEYGYQVPNYAPSGYMPMLREIWYGGNDANPTAVIPHIFHVTFVADGWSVPAPLDQLKWNTINCLQPREHEIIDPTDTSYPELQSNLRAGGALYDSDGIYNLVRAIAVEVAWPGTTDGKRREMPYRLTHYWQLGYNWDTVGCHNTDNLWPELTEIHSKGIAEDGSTTVDEAVARFSYYGWDRQFVGVPIVLPPSVARIQPAGSSTISSIGTPIPPEIWARFQNSLQLTIANAHDFVDAAGVSVPGPDSDHPSRSPWATPGIVQGLHDVDGDGRPDYLDLVTDSNCFSNGTSAGMGQWFPFGGLTSGFGNTPGNWSWISLLDPEAAIPLARTLTSSQSCGLDTGRYWLGQGSKFSIPSENEPYYLNPAVTTAKSLFLDFDGDGRSDILASQPQSSTGPNVAWQWYRNSGGNYVESSSRVVEWDS